jgi:hypothetical protein
MRLALILAFAALAARAADPEGTVVLTIEAGKSAPIQAPPGSHVICDDPAVVSGDFGSDGKGFVLRAHKTGSTLCGVWVAQQVPGGLYRVNVVSKKRGGD